MRPRGASGRQRQGARNRCSLSGQNSGIARPPSPERVQQAVAADRQHHREHGADPAPAVAPREQAARDRDGRRHQQRVGRAPVPGHDAVVRAQGHDEHVGVGEHRQQAEADQRGCSAAWPRVRLASIILKTSRQKADGEVPEARHGYIQAWPRSSVPRQHKCRARDRNPTRTGASTTDSHSGPQPRGRAVLPGWRRRSKPARRTRSMYAGCAVHARRRWPSRRRVIRCVDGEPYRGVAAAA